MLQKLNPSLDFELAREDWWKYETRFLIYMLVQRWDLYIIYGNECIYKSLLRSNCDEDSRRNRPLEKTAYFLRESYFHRARDSWLKKYCTSHENQFCFSGIDLENACLHAHTHPFSVNILISAHTRPKKSRVLISICMYHTLHVFLYCWTTVLRIISLAVPRLWQSWSSLTWVSHGSRLDFATTCEKWGELSKTISSWYTSVEGSHLKKLSLRAVSMVLVGWVRTHRVIFISVIRIPLQIQHHFKKTPSKKKTHDEFPLKLSIEKVCGKNHICGSSYRIVVSA